MTRIALGRIRNNAAGAIGSLHDARTARAYGFEAPLVPGLSVLAAAGASIRKCLDARGVGGFEARFSAPVYDGDDLSMQGGINQEYTINARGRACVAWSALDEESAAALCGLFCGFNTNYMDASWTNGDSPDVVLDSARSGMGEIVTKFSLDQCHAYHSQICEGLDGAELAVELVEPVFFLRSYLELQRAAFLLGVKGPVLHTALSCFFHSAPRYDREYRLRGRIGDHVWRGRNEVVSFLFQWVDLRSGAPIAEMKHTEIVSRGSVAG